MVSVLNGASHRPRRRGDTLMAHYLSNHIAVAYGDIFEEMVALSREMGFRIRILQGGHP